MQIKKEVKDIKNEVPHHRSNPGLNLQSPEEDKSFIEVVLHCRETVIAPKTRSKINKTNRYGKIFKQYNRK